MSSSKGAPATPSGSRPSDGVQEVSTLSGFDPSREHVRVILDCRWGDLRHALELILDARPSFDACEKRVGWGWTWYRPGGPSMFLRQTVRGYSATDTAIATEARRAETENTGSVHEGAGAKHIAPTPSPNSQSGATNDKAA